MSALRTVPRSASARERGAAVFIVLMAVTLLTAVGLYAARSAMLVDQASGFDRQAMQAHYLSVYGTLAAAADISGGRASGVMKRGITNSETCTSLLGVLPTGAEPPFCARESMREMQERVQNNFSGHKLIEPAVNGSPFIPGSLGPYPPSTGAAIDGDFWVEITEPYLLPARAGQKTGDESLKTFDVTFTVLGTVGRKFTTCNATATTVGEGRVRARVTVGPMML